MKQQTGLIALIALAIGGFAVAQPKDGAPAKYKFTTETPPGIASPDKMETRFGTLNFFDGFPDKPSTKSSTTTLTSSAPCRATCWPCPR